MPDLPRVPHQLYLAASFKNSRHPGYRLKFEVRNSNSRNNEEIRMKNDRNKY